MHAVLALQVAIGIFAAFNLHGNTFDTCLVAVKKVRDGHLVAVSLGPAHIHAHEHLRPVLCLGASGTTVDLQYSFHRVFLLAQHIHQLQLLNGLDGLAVVVIDFLFGDHFLFIEINGQLKFVGFHAHVVIAVNPFLDGLHLLHLFFGTLRVVPEIGSLRAQVFFFPLHLFLVNLQVELQLFCAV